MAKRNEPRKWQLIAVVVVLMAAALILLTQQKNIETTHLSEILQNPQEFENNSLVVEGLVNFPFSSNVLASCRGCCCSWVLVDPITKASICAPDFDKYEGKYIIANVTANSDSDCRAVLKLNSVLSEKDCINLEDNPNYKLPKSEESKIVIGHAREYYCPN